MAVVHRSVEGFVLDHHKWLLETYARHDFENSLMGRLFDVRTPFLMDGAARKIALAMQQQEQEQLMNNTNNNNTAVNSESNNSNTNNLLSGNADSSCHGNTNSHINSNYINNIVNNSSNNDNYNINNSSSSSNVYSNNINNNNANYNINNSSNSKNNNLANNSSVSSSSSVCNTSTSNNGFNLDNNISISSTSNFSNTEERNNKTGSKARERRERKRKNMSSGDAGAGGGGSLTSSETQDVLRKFERLSSSEQYQRLHSYRPTARVYLQNNRRCREAANSILDSGSEVQEVPVGDSGRNPHDYDITISNAETEYLLPPRCRYWTADVLDIDRTLPQGVKYKVIVMDPPWWNKHVKRTKRSAGDHRGYGMLSVEEILRIPVRELLRPDSVVMVWATNNTNTVQHFTRGMLLRWGLRVVHTFYWMKVTRSGRPIRNVEDGGHGKMPYERLLVALPVHSIAAATASAKYTTATCTPTATTTTGVTTTTTTTGAVSSAGSTIGASTSATVVGSCTADADALSSPIVTSDIIFETNTGINWQGNEYTSVSSTDVSNSGRTLEAARYSINDHSCEKDKNGSPQTYSSESANTIESQENATKSSDKNVSVDSAHNVLIQSDDSRTLSTDSMNDAGNDRAIINIGNNNGSVDSNNIDDYTTQESTNDVTSDDATESSHRGIHRQDNLAEIFSSAGSLIVSVPSALHSHKPPLDQLLRELGLVSSPESPFLELFARSLVPSWHSAGLQVLQLQQLQHYCNSITTTTSATVL